MNKTPLILFLLLPLPLSAPSVNSVAIFRTKGINPYVEIYNAVSIVESGKTDYKINFKEGAFGRVQIRSCKLHNFNKATGKNYQLRDCFNESVSREIFMWHIFRYGMNTEIAIKKWNGKGIKAERYLKRVKELI